MQRFLSACVIFLDNRVRLPNFPNTIKLGTGMLWQQMKGILTLQSVRDVRQSKNFWKVLGQRVQPKSQWERQAICACHACMTCTDGLLHWTHEFFLSQYWPKPRKTTEQTEILNPDWYIFVHWRVQLSCRVLTLTLRSKGRVLTSVTSCYQPSFEATRQLTIFFMIYCVFCSHTLLGLLWSHAGRSAFN